MPSFECSMRLRLLGASRIVANAYGLAVRVDLAHARRWQGTRRHDVEEEFEDGRQASTSITSTDESSMPRRFVPVSNQAYFLACTRMRSRFFLFFLSSHQLETLC